MSQEFDGGSELDNMAEVVKVLKPISKGLILEERVQLFSQLPLFFYFDTRSFNLCPISVHTMTFLLSLISIVEHVLKKKVNVDIKP